MAIAATWDFLTKVSSGSNVDEISVTGISQNYTDLYVIGMWNSTEGANGMRIRMNNNDTSSSYIQTSINSGTTQSMSQIDTIFQTWGTNGGTTLGKQFSVWHFQNYTTSNKKVAQWFGINYDVNGVDYNIGLQNTISSAITSLQFRNTGTNSGNKIASNAVFYIYGIKEA
jgi:hypothetical protein